MSKYIIARIELPLEIFPDGRYETRQEHASIEFIKCDELPTKTDLTGIDFNKILEKMDFINTNKPSSTIPPDPQPDTTIPPVKDTTEYIPKDIVLLKKKRAQNSTFKNKLHLNHRRFSLKNN